MTRPFVRARKLNTGDPAQLGSSDQRSVVRGGGVNIWFPQRDHRAETGTWILDWRGEQGLLWI